MPNVPSWQLKQASATPVGCEGIAALRVGLLYMVKGPMVVACDHSGATCAGSVLWAAWQGEQTPWRVFHTVNSELVEKSCGDPSTPLLIAARVIVGRANAAPISTSCSVFILISIARALLLVSVSRAPHRPDVACSNGNSGRRARGTVPIEIVCLLL